MSNAEAAKVYEEVVEGVVNEVRQDFENAGIDEQTLQDLRRIWQSKLSESRVARFTWDPEGVEPPREGGRYGGESSLALGGLVLKEDALLEPKDHKEKATIELTVDDAGGELAEKLKQQAKQAKKSALLETDEINSDLDDTDDEYVNFGEEENGSDVNIMLCLYEKVLRVKNKWKCNLKDGVATINNKDYAFQKSQGESEW
ncbi:AaceriAGR228Cp [[Ashbya] aceris (nom. inval.)]|nr:AaceriAGR228Cp [[Ashbya] aceris (nom. inval.)]